MEKDELNKLLDDYQKLLVQERLSLISTNEGRNELIEILVGMQEPSKQRRVNAMTLVRAIAMAKYKKDKSKELLSLLLSIKLNMEQWNRLRASVRSISKTPSTASKKWNKIEKQTVIIRGKVLEESTWIVKTCRRQIGDFGIEKNQDLESEGVLGLVRAMDKFDQTKGKGFIDYAKMWVAAQMYNYLHKDNTVTTSHQGRQLLKKMDKIKSDISMKLGREPTDEEISEYLHIDASKINSKRVSVSSMDEAIGEEDDDTMHDKMADSEDIMDEMDRKTFLDSLIKNLQKLDKDEAEIMQIRIMVDQEFIPNPVRRTPEEAREMLLEIRLKELELHLKNGD